MALRKDHDRDSLDHARTVRVPRTRGAVTGFLLIVLGIWGALIPFIGPYFNYSYGSDEAWVWTSARFWLEVLPGGVAVFGGLLLALSANRITASLGGWLAAAAGTWFIVGRTLAELFQIGSVGSPTATSDAGRAIQELGFFNGLGALILFLASFALGRLAVVGVRDIRAARRRDDQAAAERIDDRGTGVEERPVDTPAGEPPVGYERPSAYPGAERERRGEAGLGRRDR